MRIGTVLGTVTLGVRSPKYRGERLLLVLPWKSARLGGEEAYDPAIVVYDELGAATGQTIAISEGREAACPFEKPTPVDAYCAALIDELFFQPAEI